MEPAIFFPVKNRVQPPWKKGLQWQWMITDHQDGAFDSDPQIHVKQDVQLNMEAIDVGVGRPP